MWSDIPLLPARTASGSEATLVSALSLMLSDCEEESESSMLHAISRFRLVAEDLVSDCRDRKIIVNLFRIGLQIFEFFANRNEFLKIRTNIEIPMEENVLPLAEPADAANWHAQLARLFSHKLSRSDLALKHIGAGLDLLEAAHVGEDERVESLSTDLCTQFSKLELTTVVGILLLSSSSSSSLSTSVSVSVRTLTDHLNSILSIADGLATHNLQPLYNELIQNLKRRDVLRVVRAAAEDELSVARQRGAAEFDLILDLLLPLSIRLGGDHGLFDDAENILFSARSFAERKAQGSRARISAKIIELDLRRRESAGVGVDAEEEDSSEKTCTGRLEIARDFGYIPMWRQWRSRLKNIRINLRRDLAAINDSENWVGSAASVQSHVTIRNFSENLRTLVTEMCNYVSNLLGPPPFPFSILGLGSWARGTLGPYSDLDIAVLVPAEECRRSLFIQNFITLFVFQLQTLGEDDDFRSGLRLDPGDLKLISNSNSNFTAASPECPLTLNATPLGLLKNTPGFDPNETSFNPELPEPYALHRPAAVFEILNSTDGGLLAEFRRLVDSAYEIGACAPRGEVEEARPVEEGRREKGEGRQIRAAWAATQKILSRGLSKPKNKISAEITAVENIAPHLEPAPLKTSPTFTAQLTPPPPLIPPPPLLPPPLLPPPTFTPPPPLSLPPSPAAVSRHQSLDENPMENLSCLGVIPDEKPAGLSELVVPSRVSQISGGDSADMPPQSAHCRFFEIGITYLKEHGRQYKFEIERGEMEKGNLKQRFLHPLTLWITDVALSAGLSLAILDPFQILENLFLKKILSRTCACITAYALARILKIRCVAHLAAEKQRDEISQIENLENISDLSQIENLILRPAYRTVASFSSHVKNGEIFDPVVSDLRDAISTGGGENLILICVSNLAKWAVYSGGEFPPKIFIEIFSTLSVELQKYFLKKIAEETSTMEKRCNISESETHIWWAIRNTENHLIWVKFLTNLLLQFPYDTSGSRHGEDESRLEFENLKFENILENTEKVPAHELVSRPKVTTAGGGGFYISKKIQFQIFDCEMKPDVVKRIGFTSNFAPVLPLALSDSSYSRAIFSPTLAAAPTVKNYLRSRIAAVFGHECELFKIETPNSSLSGGKLDEIPMFILWRRAMAEICVRDLGERRLDPKSFTLQVIFTLLWPSPLSPDTPSLSPLSPSPLSPGDFLWRFTGDADDIFFVCPLEELKTIVFCLDEMLAPVDESAAAEVLTLEISKIISKIIACVERDVGIVAALFPGNPIFTNLIPNGQIATIYTRWRRLEAALKRQRENNLKKDRTDENRTKNSTAPAANNFSKFRDKTSGTGRSGSRLSNLDLISRVDPHLSLIYRKLLENYPSPIERYEALENDVSNFRDRDSDFSSRSRSDDFSGRAGEGGGLTASGMAAELLCIDTQYKKKDKIREDLIRGVSADFLSASPLVQESVLASLDFSNLISSAGPDGEKANMCLQTNILKTVCAARLDIRELNFSSATALSNTLLKNILDNCVSGVIRLDVSHCVSLDCEVFRSICKRCGKTLENLNISNLPHWTSLSTLGRLQTPVAVFHRLKKIIGYNCPGLATFFFDAPNLDEIIFPQSLNLVLPTGSTEKKERFSQSKNISSTGLLMSALRDRDPRWVQLLAFPAVLASSNFPALIFATENNNFSAVKILLRHLIFSPSEITLALHASAKYTDNISLAKILLAESPTVINFIGGARALQISAENSRRNIAEFLARSGAEIFLKIRNDTSEIEITPLETAALSGDLEIVRMLINVATDRQLPDSKINFVRALFSAIQGSHESVVKFLLEKNVDVNFPLTSPRLFPIHKIATHAAASAVQILKSIISAKADISARDDSGNSVLHIAAQLGRTDICAEILTEISSGNNSLEIDALNFAGDTPMIISAANGHKSVCSLLLTQKASVNFQNSNSKTSPLLAASATYDPNIVNLILENGGDAAALDLNGFSALHFAALKGKVDVLKILLATPVAAEILNSKNNYGDTAVHMAILGGEKKAILTLLDAHADPSLPNTHGDAPLHFAASVEKVDAETCQIFLNSKASPLLVNEDQRLPLHLAAATGNIQKVRFFVENSGGGAAVDAREGSGATPLFIASGRGFLDVVNFLLKNKSDPNAAAKNGDCALKVAMNGGHVTVVRKLLKSNAVVPADLAERVSALPQKGKLEALRGQLGL